MAVASKAKVHDAFTRLLTGMAGQAKAQQSAQRGTGQRPWNRPAEVADVLDVPGISAGFDRAAINTNFEQVVADGKSPGTVGDVVSLKTQVDYMAVHERGFRARHCTPVRLMALAAARRKGHGHDRGVLAGGVIKYVQDALKAGQP